MNKFNADYDFSAIQSHIERARLERSVAIARLLARGVEATVRGLRALKESLQGSFHAVMHRTISADSLARRSVPRY